MNSLTLVLPEERQRVILSLVQRDGRVLAADLARSFGTSEDTIRRDLRELAASGHVQRVHGGAVRRAVTATPYAEREMADRPRKDVIARTAAGLVQAREVVLVDAGSTNLAVVRNLPRELEATVITNSPAIAAALVGHETIEVIMLGGSVSHRVGAVTGAGITDAIRQFRADLCILGACSLSAEMGIGSMYADDAIAKRAMIDVSNRVVAAMLNDKLGSSAPFAVAPLAALDQIVVEADAPDAFLEQLSALPGPQILRAGGESR